MRLNMVFATLKKDGLLQISIEPLPKGVLIAVTDNGMGRKEASKYHDSSGYGLKTMEEFYRLFEKYHGYSIKSRIIDLEPKKDNQSGLRVELRVQNEH